jgi:hypothetical protein
MEFYFVCTSKTNKIEIEPIRALRPKRLLVSYHYFKNIDFQEFFKIIGYEPEIFYDSGAYSAFTSGKPIKLESYIQKVKEVAPFVKRYFCLDIIGDDLKSYEAWEQMRAEGLNPIPVFHYQGDETILQKYIEAGADLIGLGGTVPIKSKKDVAAWARMIAWQYPANYHLLGTAHRIILDEVDLYSADASTWVMQAVFGNPKHIPGNDTESRTMRAYYNMKRLMERYE